MYTDYYGLRELPFSVTPNPRFFYSNRVYEEAFANLQYGIQGRKGFVLMTGEVGTGKTTLLRRLIDGFDDTVASVFLFNTRLGFDEILSYACDELGVVPVSNERLLKIQALYEFLLAQVRKGGTTALLIDEAQNLGGEVLEDLRLLSNLETTEEKLLQIVLVGQPELEEKLAQPELRQIRQRIALRCRIDRLRSREVAAFIGRRLESAGWSGGELFTPEAIEEIARLSRGVPRLINVICDNALLIGYATSRRTIEADVVAEVGSDLQLADPARSAGISSLGLDQAFRGLQEKAAEALDAGPMRIARTPPRRQASNAGWAGAFVLLLAIVGGLVLSLRNGFGWSAFDAATAQAWLEAAPEELREIGASAAALMGVEEAPAPATDPAPLPAASEPVPADPAPLSALVPSVPEAEASEEPPAERVAPQPKIETRRSRPKAAAHRRAAAKPARVRERASTPRRTVRAPQVVVLAKMKPMKTMNLEEMGEEAVKTPRPAASTPKAPARKRAASKAPARRAAGSAAAEKSAEPAIVREPQSAAPPLSFVADAAPNPYYDATEHCVTQPADWITSSWRHRATPRWSELQSRDEKRSR